MREFSVGNVLAFKKIAFFDYCLLLSPTKRGEKIKMKHQPNSPKGNSFGIMHKLL